MAYIYPWDKVIQLSRDRPQVSLKGYRMVYVKMQAQQILSKFEKLGVKKSRLEFFSSRLRSSEFCLFEARKLGFSISFIDKRL